MSTATDATTVVPERTPEEERITKIVWNQLRQLRHSREGTEAVMKAGFEALGRQIEALDVKVEALGQEKKAPVHVAMTVLEQHALQQRGSDY